MRSTAGEEEYEIGSVRVAGLGEDGGVGEWTGVGIRFKGFFGSLRQCLIPGFADCKKLSYKLKFDYVNADQRFFGLKRLQLHASINDESLMRERLAYSLFREMGVPTVRQTYATVTRTGAGSIGTDHLGVHLLTDVLDGRWTDATFRGGDGNLYKEAWPELNEGARDKKTVRAPPMVARGVCRCPLSPPHLT